MDKLKIAEKIEVWRKRNGLTQDYVAGKLDITRQTYSQRVKGNCFKKGELLILNTLGFEQ